VCLFEGGEALGFWCVWGWAFIVGLTALLGVKESPLGI
jgi:hypothetical protein